MMKIDMDSVNYFSVEICPSQCLMIKKKKSGGYLIESAWIGDDEKLNGKIVIEHDVEPIIMGSRRRRKNDAP
jgi:hypothetical protein